MSEHAPGMERPGSFIIIKYIAQSAVLSVQQCVSVTEQWMAASRPRLNMCQNIPDCCHSLILDGAQVVGLDAVRVLGVLLTSNLSLDKHVTAVSAKCFF